jgi:hypothetical protein
MLILLKKTTKTYIHLIMGTGWISIGIFYPSGEPILLGGVGWPLPVNNSGLFIGYDCHMARFCDIYTRNPSKKGDDNESTRNPIVFGRFLFCFFSISSDCR